MSNALAVTEGPESDTSSAAVLSRAPFYFESRGRPLFAWLHRRGDAPLSAHGVLLCPPVGHEQIHSHRGLRHLVAALALAGFAVVRFDYDGTGDSGGTEEDPDRLAMWLANVRDARAWMHHQLGCERVSLVGLRLGAALAAETAAESAVDSLVLWAPVVKGRAFVRELKALALAGEDGVSEAVDIEAAGFVFTEQTTRDLARLDLLQLRPCCRRALIVARDDMPGDTRLIEHFRAVGVEVEQIARPGYAELMAEPHCTQVPRQTIADIVAWLLAGERSAEPADASSSNDIDLSADAILFSGSVASDAARPLRERAVHLGRQPELFGIVSEPCDGPDETLPSVLLVNAGSSYRVGPNRLHVRLTRQLASCGFRCLRLDLGGLGDSPVSDPDRENDPYPVAVFRDIDIALQFLEQQFGARRVVLMGLCSGAYAAFQSAAQLSSPLLVESVLINPLTFFWREGMSLEASPAARLQSWTDSLAALRRPEKWLRVLTGRSKMGFTGVLKILRDRWKLRDQFGGSNPAEDDEAAAHLPSHPSREDLPGDLRRIAAANRHLACFFARSDPGYGLLMFSAKRMVRELRRTGRMSVYCFDGADHTFSRRTPRRTLIQAIAEHLCRRYLPPSGPFGAARCSASTRPR